MKKLVIKAAKGSMTQFRSALENKIAEIQHSDVQNCRQVMAQTIPEDDPARIRYLHDLVGWVQYQMGQEDLPVNQTTFDTTDDALVIIVGGDGLMQYEVPFEDLKFDFAKIWDDVEYIMSAMIGDDNRRDTITSSAKTNAFQLSSEDREELNDIVEDQLYQAWDNYRGEGLSVQKICTIVWEHVYMILTEYPEDYSETLAELAQQNKSALKKMVNEAVRSSYSDYDWD